MKNVDQNPFVSIIIPTYNGEKYLEEALLSVFNQTYKNYEVIVVDDGSVTDKVKKICDKYVDRIIYIRQENKGLSGARNTGIRNSKGEYIAFLDDDDLWFPEKLEKQVSYYEELARQGINAGLIYTGWRNIVEGGHESYKVLYRAHGFHYEPLLFIYFIGPPSCVLIKRSVLDHVGFFDEELKGAQDWDLFLRISRHYPIYSLNEFLTKYRDGSSSLSKNVPLMIKDTLRILDKIIEIEKKDPIIDDETKKKLINKYKKDVALSWKDTAYKYLFIKKDGRVFREYIGNGYRNDRSLFGFKVASYYILSFFSPMLCKLIKNLKKEKVLIPKDTIHDVSSLKF